MHIDRAYWSLQYHGLAAHSLVRALITLAVVMPANSQEGKSRRDDRRDAKKENNCTYQALSLRFAEPIYDHPMYVFSMPSSDLTSFGSAKRTYRICIFQVSRQGRSLDFIDSDQTFRLPSLCIDLIVETLSQTITTWILTLQYCINASDRACTRSIACLCGSGHTVSAPRDEYLHDMIYSRPLVE